jgi:hypothetical protein
MAKENWSSSQFTGMSNYLTSLADKVKELSELDNKETIRKIENLKKVIEVAANKKKLKGKLT